MVLEKISLKFFIKILLLIIIIIASVNLTFILFGTIEKYNFKFQYKKISSIFIKSSVSTNKTNISFPSKNKIYKPERFFILDRSKLLKSDLLKPKLSLTEIEKMSVTNIKPHLTPSLYLIALRKDDEWKGLEEPKDNVKHKLDFKFKEWETQLRVYGRQKIGLKYGWSVFLEKPKYADASAHSSAVTRGFKPHQSLEIHIKGKVGKKVTIDIDSSGRQEVDTYKVEYKAIKRREFIQNIVAGNIGVSVPGSAYASGGSGGSKSAFGIKAIAQRGNFKYQAIASMTRGITEVKHFKGTSQLVVKNISDLNYIKKKYYLLNDGQPIEPGSLVVYLDDENGNNNFGTTPIPYYDTNTSSWETNDCDLLYSGVDYIIDYNTGVLIFKRGISENYDILITYNKYGGSKLTPYSGTNVNIAYRVYVTNNLDNKEYIFLQRKSTVSPYEYKGIYDIGNRNIQKNNKDFKITILDKNFQPLTPQPFSEINSANYTGTGLGYYIDEVKGYIIFNDSQPFEKFSGSYYKDHPSLSIYTYHPLSEYSKYYIHIEYRYETRQFQLHWDLIQGSEKVYLNGRQLVRNKDYTIDYTTGRLEFIPDRVTITPDSDIDIVYEYLPFGGGLQQILAGLRVDYTPYTWFNLGAVGFYNGRQTPARVPGVRNASDNRWVGSIFGKANFDNSILKEEINDIFSTHITNMPVSFSVNGEYAGSYYNINTFGQGMIDDFEGTVESMSISVREGDWYICTPSGADESTRGKIYYKDYRDYDDDERLQPLSWNKEYTAPYTVKPGPYNVNEGHLSIAQLPTPYTIQRSLVFDYDFTGGKNWVSVVRRYAYSGGGRDFRNYTDLVLWVKLVSSETNAKVKLHIDIGRFSEDLDRDGVFDKEISKNDGGFLFNPAGGFATWIGGGPKFTTVNGDYLYANGGIDTEDLDRNGYLDTLQNDEVISLPAGTSGDYAKTTSGSTTLEIGTEGGQWQMIRITLNKDLLADELQDLLRRIKNIRITLEKISGDTGKLLINEMYFSGLTWHNIKINEQATTYSNQNYFKVYPINTFDSSDYHDNSLRKYDSDAYDDLHGPITEEEAEQENEQALVLEYNNLGKHNFNISIDSNYYVSGKYTCGWVSRTYPDFDMRYYKKMKIWVYIPPSVHPVGEYFFVRFGGENNYYEYREKLDWVGWKQVVIDLRSDEFLSLHPRQNIYTHYKDGGHWRVVNLPNLRHINYIALGIYGSPTTDGATGHIWVNDFYLDDVEKLSDKAYSIRGNFNIKNHLNLNATYSYRGKDFSSIGGLGSGRESGTISYSGSWNSIKWFPVTGSWSKTWSRSDIDEIFVPINEQGYSISRSWNLNASWNIASMPGIKSFYPQYWPKLNGGYSTSVSSNRKPLSWISDSDYRTTYYAHSYSYNLGMSEKIPFVDLIGINVMGQGNHSFSKSESHSINYTYNSTNENRYTVSSNYNAGINISWNVGGNMSSSKVRISPRYSYRYGLSRTSMKSNIWNLNTRSRAFNSSISLPQILFIRPSINYNFNYNESGFHYKNTGRTIFDENPYNLSQFDSDTNLYKNATTSQNYSLSIGSFNIDWFIFKTFTPSFSQNMGFSQSDVSVISNTPWDVWSKFAKSFLFKLPGNYLYIPVINPHYKSFEFVQQYSESGTGASSSLSLGNSFSARWGVELSKLSIWSFSYSLNQNTSRSYSSYNISQSWNLSASSSLDLMRIFNFFIWKKSKEYNKSSVISYGASYRQSNNFLQKSLSRNLSPYLNFNYRWKADKSISWSLSYSYNESTYEPFDTFYNILKTEYPDLYESIAPKNIVETPPKKSYSWRFSTSYSYSSDLPEYWKPPLFKKPWHLGYKVRHSDSLKFYRQTYDYGVDERLNKDYIHPKEMLYQIAWTHNFSFEISKNINGGGWGKFVIERTRTERGELGNDNDDKESIFAWEVGINATIRF